MNKLRRRYEAETGRTFSSGMQYTLWLERQLTWRPAIELPARGQVVLATYKDKNGVRKYVRAEYIRKYQQKPDFIYDNKDDCDYVEETGEYFLEEGWYELIENCPDDFPAIVYGEIDYWLPMPKME